MVVRTPLCDLLAIEHPILLAPMAGVSGGALAAAVSRAGGLGLIGGGYGNRDWLDAELAAAGNTKVGAGFITWSLARQPALLDQVLHSAPPAVMLSFGDFKPFAERIKQSKAKLIVQVQTVEQARKAIAGGTDIIVAQGTEAGGHGGMRATLPLVPAVVDIAGSIPVVAAGGITDGRGLAAALMLGAAGVLCGSAFYVSDESLAQSRAKQTAVNANGDNTERGSVFDIVRGLDWPPEWNIRTLQNDFTQRWSTDIDGLHANLPRERERFDGAQEAGDTNVSAVIVGEGIGLVRKTEPAADIVARFVLEAEQTLRTAGTFL